MAKEKNGRAKWIGLVITLAVLFAGIVTTWAVYGEDIEHNTKNITTNTKALGIINDPKDGPIVKIAVMQKDIEYIKELQVEQKAEQKEGFREIKEILKDLSK